MVARPQSSAVGVLALLSEPEPLLKQHALKSLIPLVSQFWAEISEHISHMYVYESSRSTQSFMLPNIYSESLYESDELVKPARDLAALLASKVYYCLGEYDEALSFALGAGPAFESETRVPGSAEYVETIVCE
jgi:26S proteasome regulatory subunit N2